MSDIQRYLRCARSGDMLPDRCGAWWNYEEATDEIERLRELSGDLMAERNECREERERLRKELRDCNNWIRSELGLEEAEEIAQRLG